MRVAGVGYRVQGYRFRVYERGLTYQGKGSRDQGADSREYSRGQTYYTPMECAPAARGNPPLLAAAPLDSAAVCL